MITTKIYENLGMTFLDYPDPINPAILIYFLGCDHSCPECHNEAFKNRDFDKGVEVSIESLFYMIKDYGHRNHTNKIVFSGGDPLHPLNRSFVRTFINKYSNVFDVCIYTGYEISEVKNMELTGFKFLKCGKYNKALHQEAIKTDSFMKFASTNQSLYNSIYSLLTHNGTYNFK